MFRTVRPEPDPRRQVLVHYHVFKNAGSTLDSILEANFGDRFARLDGDRHDSNVCNDALIAFLERLPALAAVTSHHLRPPKPADPRFAFHDIVFIRHPLARLASAYAFYRRAAPNTDPLAAAAKLRGLQAFFDWLIDDHPRYVSNVQVNLIANAGAWLPRADDLARAVRIVQEATIAGTVERFDESAVAAEHVLSPHFRGIEFSYVAQNVSCGPRSLDAQLHLMRTACGTGLYNHLVELNRLDLALFDTATETVSHRLATIADHGRRLKELRLRCGARQRAAAALILTSNHPVQFVRYANLGIP